MKGNGIKTKHKVYTFWDWRQIWWGQLRWISHATKTLDCTIIVLVEGATTWQKGWIGDGFSPLGKAIHDQCWMIELSGNFQDLCTASKVADVVPWMCFLKKIKYDDELLARIVPKGEVRFFSPNWKRVI